MVTKKIRGGFKETVTENNEVTFRQYPAIARMQRMSGTRYERLKALLKYFKEGKSVQEIVEITGWKKDVIYHEMYALRNYGLLPADFKNPKVTVHGDVLELLKKEAENGNTD